ncbi:Hypp4120 [Branchiostoma lanceolatum]|uniref:Hypp4120 protein n=1 Tax=Branchiostoma lanceolatum TaxID=7740 RepID=A0A8K0EWN4_BRALA|nr:Hypp4120 [Branchiostoma lanceolatum]
MLYISDNPITAIFDVSELKHISWLMLTRNKIQCDCRLRQIKKRILANERSVWLSCIVKATGKINHVRYVHWDDLRCSSPDVSVIVDNGVVTGNASLTCQTDCLDGLTFPWITSSGHHSSSSYEDSKNYIRENNSSCKGSPVTTLETRRMCFSVLSVSTVGNDTEGMYTCRVNADHTDNASVSVFLTVDDIETVDRIRTSELQTTARNTINPAGDKDVEEGTAHRPGHGLSTSQLIFAVLGSFCGFYVIVGVVAACVSKCKGGRLKGNAGGQGNAANRHYENDDQFSDTDGASEHDYENDDQFSDTDGASEHDYENDDQFSDTDGSSEHDYENDDQFSDTDGASEHDYENDDQFSDTDGARGGNAYENDDQFSDTDGARGGNAYENDDQFSDTDGAKGGHYENDDQFSDDDVIKHPHKTIPGDKAMSSTDKARRARRLHNRSDLVKTRGIPSNHRAVAIANMVAAHAEAQSGGHYDNERSGKAFGRRVNGNKARTTANNAACEEKEQSAGRYDNDKNMKGMASNKTQKTDDDSDSDHDYMSLPPNGPTEEDTGGVQCESTSEVLDPDSTSNHGYMTLPPNDPTEEDTGGVQCESTSEVMDPDSASNHGYMSLPPNGPTEGDTGGVQCESTSEVMDPDSASDHGYMTLPPNGPTEGDTGGVQCENTPVVMDPASASDHGYMTLPPNGPTEEDTGGVQCESTSEVMDPDSASDHDYMTLPGTENSDEQQEETDLKEGQVSDSVTSSSNVEDNPDHTYVSFLQSRKSDEQQQDLYGTE